MQNAFAEIVKERDRVEKDFEEIKKKIVDAQEKIQFYREKASEKETLLKEYDQIIEALKGVTV